MMEGTGRNKTRKKKPDVSKNYGATQSYRNTLNSGGHLIYDSLRMIFQYLNARDLGSAAMVCRSWLEAANDEKLIRGPCCFRQCYMSQRRYIHNTLRYKVKNIRCKPSAGFFFRGDIDYRMEDYIEDLLPDHCEAIMLCGDGTILDNAMEYYSCCENSSPRMVCAFLPQIPNVRIKLFKLVDHCVIPKSPEYQEIISTIDETSLSNHETSTCFMLFSNWKGHTLAKRWVLAMQQSKEVNIVSVWGSKVNQIYVKRDATADCVAVLITGPIQTWSTILDMDCKTVEQIEARLKLFKDEVKLKKHSIGFVFATTGNYECNAREELTIFKRLFPKVPLAGCFVETTTFDKVNKEKNDEEEHKCKKSLDLSWYKYRTEFLILTYG